MYGEFVESGRLQRFKGSVSKSGSEEFVGSGRLQRFGGLYPMKFGSLLRVNFHHLKTYSVSSSFESRGHVLRQSLVI